jgi:hypothetical protein
MSAKLMPTFADKGVARSAQRIPTAINLGFLNPESLLFQSKSSSIILTRLNEPRSRPTTSQKNLAAPKIEHGISGFVARNSDH